VTQAAPGGCRSEGMRTVIGILIAVVAAALFLGVGGPDLKGHIGLLAAAIGGGVIAFRGLLAS
jgi:hypothetical protein